MHIDILTLFPQMFCGPFSESILKKAQEKGLFSIKIINIRDFTEDKHKTADDTPYGGGPGMVMKVEPLYKALKHLIESSESSPKILFMSPSGKTLSQKTAKELSKENHIIILCGHYETIDERIIEHFQIEEISIGDYVLTGGEIPAMGLVDCICRLIPSVVKEEDSIIKDSFYDDLLDYPSYTKPYEFESLKVPDVLKSGHHAEIVRWQKKEALKRTLFKRPDLFAKAQIEKTDTNLIEEIVLEQ